MKSNRNDITLFQKAALATLITLIIVLSTLLAFEMNTKRKHQEFVVLVDEQDFEVPDPFEKEKRMNELDKSINEMLEQEMALEERKNIAVNKANKPTNEEHTQTRLEQNQTEEDYRQQLIQNAIGQEEYDKYIKNKPTYDEGPEITVPVKSKPQNVKKEVYTGPSNIIFYLDDRQIRYIDVPVYLCQGSADITVKIVVLPNGLVKRAQLDEQASTSTDECFTEAALKAAQNAIFTRGKSGEQSGKIKFHFVAQ